MSEKTADDYLEVLRIMANKAHNLTHQLYDEINVDAAANLVRAELEAKERETKELRKRLESEQLDNDALHLKLAAQREVIEDAIEQAETQMKAHVECTCWTHEGCCYCTAKKILTTLDKGAATEEVE